ncbi:hypothetical protein [Actinomycetospora lemnae]|uniref:HNH endonuclease n=1 Tax=Actinomycetospora lemnae TaxID=3019891 RepID=A0ABT5STE3_9PSEU|nr:hypothetical protein [Actinomycetospora sp. DW7H6]MDD7966113.1 hypothetical protein [Actinomycetospora sp. DW7H6]
MSTRRGRGGQPCALCAHRPSSRRGEHVLPTWLIDARFPASDRPFTSGPTGQAIRSYDHFQRVMLPCCRECNSVLEHRFETPAHEAIERLLDGHEVPPGPDADLVRRWLLKTWLLLAHPRAEYKDSVLQGAVLRWRHAPWVFGWMVQGTEPPEGLSAWAFRYVTPYEKPEQPELVDLATGWRDGTFVEPEVFELALQTLNVVVVHHPGLRLELAAERRGELVRLWPAPRGTAITGLPTHHARPVLWRVG